MEAEIKQTEFVADITHTVKKGDNLFEIASKHGVSLETLMKHNGIANPHIIWIGQEIKIPGTKKKTVTKKAEAAE